jgi:hypothetical protein
MRAWAFIALGLVIAVVAVLGPPLIQLQKDLGAWLPYEKPPANSFFHNVAAPRR